MFLFLLILSWVHIDKKVCGIERVDKCIGIYG